jgi:cytochrome c-type biogenesis protein CcmH/NrfG
VGTLQKSDSRFESMHGALVSAYIQKLVDIQDQREYPLTQNELVSIAHELGLTQEHLALLATEHAGHLTRSKGYLAHQRWSDAVSELTDALALDPLSAETALLLAEAYKQRWVFEAQPNDRSQAERYAKYALRLAPDQPRAYAILADLEKMYVSIPSLNEPNPSEGWAIALSIGLGLVLVLVLVWLLV